jgi:hypothetical protein
MANGQSGFKNRKGAKAMDANLFRYLTIDRIIVASGGIKVRGSCKPMHI